MNSKQFILTLGIYIGFFISCFLWNDLYAEIFGEITPVTYLAAFFFAITGQLLAVGIGVLLRDKSSKNTPRDFDPLFFWADSKSRLYLTLLIAFAITFLAFRFTYQMLNVTLDMWVALCIGAGLDRIIFIYIKKTNAFGRDQVREKFQTD